MAFTMHKKAICVLEFAKTESIVTVQRRFRIMYHTEPHTDKKIREWYMKFQQSGCLCAAKRTGSHSAGIEIQLYPFMTTALEEGERLVARPGRSLPVGKTRYPFYRRLGRPQGRSGRAENLAPTVFDSRTVQPVVSRYKD